MKRIILLLSIFFDAAFMLALTPVVVILGGVFQTLDEWRDSIREWGANGNLSLSYNKNKQQSND